MSESASMTVAIPTMNGARHLTEALHGVLAQESAVSEILISDDRSDDETLKIVSEVAGDRARVSTNSERLGLAGNWNRCLALGTTPLMTIVHQDDVLRPGHIASHRAAFAAEPDVGIVSSASDVIGERGEIVPETIVGRGGLGSRDRLFAPGEAIPLMSAANPLRCSAVSVRANVVEDVGGFDARLRYVVDWEFWLRVAQRWSLSWLAKPTVDIRWHSGSETHRFHSGTVDLEETEAIFERNLAWLKSQGLPTASVGRAGQSGLARAYLNRAYIAVRAGNGREGRSYLRRALAHRPGIVRELAADPRLGALMAATSVAPELSGRWFKRLKD